MNLSLVPGLDTTPDPSVTLGNVPQTSLRARFLTPYNRLVSEPGFRRPLVCKRPPPAHPVQGRQRNRTPCAPCF